MLTCTLDQVLNTKDAKVNQFLKNASIVIDNGVGSLTLSGREFTTQSRNPVTYIGEVAREKARQLKIEELSNAISEIDNDITNINSEKINLVKSIELLNSVSEAFEELDKLNESAKTLTQEKDVLQKTIDELKNRRQPILNLVGDLSEIDCTNMVSDYKAYISEKTSLEKDILSCEKDIAREQKIISDAEKSITGYESRLAELNNQLEDSQNKLYDIQQDDNYIQQTKNLETLENRMVINKSALNTLRIDVKKLTIDNANLHTTRDNERESLVKLKDLYEKLLEFRNTIVIDDYQIEDDLTEVSLPQGFEYVAFDTTNVTSLDGDLRDQIKTARNEDLAKKIAGIVGAISNVTVRIPNTQTGTVDVVDIASHMNQLRNELNTLSSDVIQRAEIFRKTLYVPMIDAIRDTHSKVESAVSTFLNHMNRPNPSDFQLRANIKETDTGFEIKDLLTTSGTPLTDPAVQNFFDELYQNVQDIMSGDDDTLKNADVITARFLSKIEPRNWYEVNIEYNKDAEGFKPLTDIAIKSTFSVGQRMRTYYTPLLALLNSIKERFPDNNAPVILHLDEAFFAIDETQTKHLLEQFHDVADVLLLTSPGGLIPLTHNAPRAKYCDIIKTSVLDVNGNDVMIRHIREYARELTIDKNQQGVA